MAGDVAPSPHPLPRSDPSLSIQPIAGERGQKMAAADFSNAHTQTSRESQRGPRLGHDPSGLFPGRRGGGDVPHLAAGLGVGLAIQV